MNINPPRVYGLSFLPSEQTRDGSPTIVLSINSEYAEQFLADCRRIADLIHSDVFTYLGFKTSFELENEMFGFGGVGSIIREQTSLDIHFGICSDTDVQKSLVVSLCIALGSLVLHIDIKSNGQVPPGEEAVYQLLQLDTAYNVGMFGAHTVGGYIFPKLGAWLEKQAASIPPHKPHTLPQQLRLSTAEAAMKKVWKVVAVDLQKEFSDDCYALINSSGAFLLGCFGNACDIGIYPDRVYDSLSTTITNISSHNLDSVAQQLTLVTGIAALHQLADSEL